jgi:hypothetical protein
MAEQQSLDAHACTSEGRLRARMAASNYYYIEIIWKNHQLT